MTSVYCNFSCRIIVMNMNSWFLIQTWVLLLLCDVTSNGWSAAAFPLPGPVMAFAPIVPGRQQQQQQRQGRNCALIHRQAVHAEDVDGTVTRRDFAFSAASQLLLATAALTANVVVVPAAADASDLLNYGSSPDHPVAVIGANGRTGMEVVQALAKQGIYTVTLTRTGNDPFRLVKLPADQKQYVQHYDQPVVLPALDTLQNAVSTTHASALIYCASASKQGGSAFQVDDVGVGAAAQVAEAVNARLVVISALAVDRPDSKSFQITNTIGGNYNGIMDAKRQGEEKVRQIMKKSKNYIILRPGVLLSGKGSGSALDLELNQGDTVGGGLSRDELAQLAVAALAASNKGGVTVEAYRKKTATKLQPEFAVPSGRELTSNTYVGLFKKALPDEGGMPYLPK